MKKTLVALLAATFITVGAAQAATTSPVSRWLNKTSAAVTNAENSYNNTKQQAVNAKKDAAARKAAAKARKKELKDSVDAEKSFWKNLFSRN